MSTGFTELAAMHYELFGEFAEAATYVRGTAAAVTTRVIVDDGSQTVGNRGEIQSNKRVITSIKSEYAPQRGDEITVRGVLRKVDAILVDDGYVVQAVLHG